MATLVGKIDPFNPTNVEVWTHYVKRLEYYFLTIGITAADKKQAVLISIMGSDAYRLLQSPLSPSKPSKKSFAQIVEVLKDHYNPQPSEIMRRFHFNSRTRKSRPI